MTQSQVAIVIINWKLKDETLRCLESVEILKRPANSATHIIVVDNGSEDGLSECIANDYPQAQFIAQPTNIGFGAACNLAVRQIMRDTDCDYVFFLNNDALVHSNMLIELLEVAESHPEVGIFGPKIYCQHNPRTVWYAGARKRWGVLAAVDTGRGCIDHGQFDTLREVDYVFGAAMLIRRRVFEEIGLFDERFFLYLEDMDFCLRAQKAGFTLLFVPQAHVWHKGSASTANHNGFRKYHFVKSTICFIRKHTSLVLLPYAMIFWMLVLLRFICTDVLHGDFVAVRSYWKGLVGGLKLLVSDRLC